MAINVPFHTDTERANMLPFDIKIDKVGDRDVHITLQRNGATVTSDGWLSVSCRTCSIVSYLLVRRQVYRISQVTHVTRGV